MIKDGFKFLVELCGEGNKNENLFFIFSWIESLNFGIDRKKY